MKTAAVLVAGLAVLGLADPAAAQFRTVPKAPDTWATAWVGGYLSPGRVSDASGNWDFGSTFAGGLGVHRQIGRSLVLGVETSFAPAAYERRDADDGSLLGEGNARLVTGMLTGRLQTGGGSNFGMYLTGGAGAFVYGIPELDRWDPDLALTTGAGLEYRPSANRALFVEWGRYWTFHQKEGVRDNTAKHSQLRAGVRIGF
ncbi:MAG TPA: outer membrane beta-barrel protein [Longimicrobiales bacterium]